MRAWRFARRRGRRTPCDAGAWTGPAPASWTSSLDRAAYVDAVDRVRAHIQEGDVYQANLCRVLSAPLPGRARRACARRGAGARATRRRTRAACTVPGEVWVVTASPELFLRVEDGVVTRGPIKGTAATRGRR